MKKRIILSWSGGKDCCMALDALVKQGYEIVSLVTTAPEDLERTYAHGERTGLIQLQGEALGIPVYFIAASFEKYTERFIEGIIDLKNQYGITGIAFGDLYLEGHREWGEKVAEAAGVEALYPLWTKQEAAHEALEQFVRSGYLAVVVRVRDDILDDSWLGRMIDESFFQDIQKTSACPMGESGEYHTFVFDGPLFFKKMTWDLGETVHHEAGKKFELRNIRLE